MQREKQYESHWELPVGWHFISSLCQRHLHHHGWHPQVLLLGQDQGRHTAGPAFPYTPGNLLKKQTNKPAKNKTKHINYKAWIKQRLKLLCMLTEERGAVQKFCCFSEWKKLPRFNATRNIPQVPEQPVTQYLGKLCITHVHPASFLSFSVTAQTSHCRQHEASENTLITTRFWMRVESVLLVLFAHYGSCAPPFSFFFFFLSAFAIWQRRVEASWEKRHSPGKQLEDSFWPLPAPGKGQRTTLLTLPLTNPPQEIRSWLNWFSR